MARLGCADWRCALPDGSVAFQFTDPSGRTTSETYSPGRRPPPGGKGGADRRPKGKGDDPPPGKGKRPPPPRGNEQTFPEKTLPRILACVDGKPLLAVMKNYTNESIVNCELEVQRLNSEGTPWSALPISASDIELGVQTGTIWLQTKESILRIDQDGSTVLTIPLPPDSKGVQIGAF